MTKKPSAVALKPLSFEKDLGGLSELERRLVYAHCGLSPAQVANVEIMVSDSGMRDVGEGALNNVRVQFSSKKNRRCRTVESHTCERLFAYELEMDPAVLCYYVQVPCRRILRVRDNGQQHVSQATLDFLVFYQESIKIVECKYEKWLKKETASSTKWRQTERGWMCEPYETWARANGLCFEIWYPPWPLGIYLRNQEAIYAMKDVALNSSEQRAAERAVAKIATSPHSVDGLCAVVPDFRERIALWLIAHCKAFGPIQSTSIEMGDRFLLYVDAQQAALADQVTFGRIGRDLQQPQIGDPLITASVTDYQAALKRLARLEAIASGKEAPTRRMDKLARLVRNAVADGRSPLSACLTGFAKGGNRVPRLLKAQQDAMHWAINTQWNRNKVRSKRALWFALEEECERRAIPAPSMAVLNRTVAGEDATRRALAQGGMRGYQAARASSDPRDRSLKALGFGHTLHIDSSQFDTRCAPDLVLFFPAEKPTFYIGVDEAASMPMAHSFIFGSARTDGFAILIREFVFRHGFLPAVIFVDRGPENTSAWLKQFCRENGISLMHSPTGGSKFNSLAENCIKQVNTNVAHDLVGSTLPDMKGRAVDGKFKSRKNARTAFMRIVQAFNDFVYGDLARTPQGNGGTPSEMRDEALARYGLMGALQAYNDDLIIKTSVSIDYTGKATEKRGIRTKDGFFTSEELKPLLRTQQPEDVRQDCVDPSVLHVKICSAWVKAFHSSVLTIASLTSTEKLFELLSAPLTKRQARHDKRIVDRDRYRRNQAAAALPSHSHLAPAPEAMESADESDNEAIPAVEWDSLALLTEE